MRQSENTFPSTADDRLLEVAELLALGLKRAEQRSSTKEPRQSSTGLSAKNERELRLEGGA
jgi:hypothetical protein